MRTSHFLDLSATSPSTLGRTLSKKPLGPAPPTSGVRIRTDDRIGPCASGDQRAGPKCFDGAGSSARHQSGVGGRDKSGEKGHMHHTHPLIRRDPVIRVIRTPDVGWGQPGRLLPQESVGLARASVGPAPLVKGLRIMRMTGLIRPALYWF
jgi:hypothetical protein